MYKEALSKEEDSRKGKLIKLVRRIRLVYIFWEAYSFRKSDLKVFHVALCGAWWAAVHGVAEGRTRLSDVTFTFHFHALEKEMATHSSVLAWRIPGTGEPGGLPSMGSRRVGHDWSDLAAAAAGCSARLVTCPTSCVCLCTRTQQWPWGGRTMDPLPSSESWPQLSQGLAALKLLPPLNYKDNCVKQRNWVKRCAHCSSSVTLHGGTVCKAHAGITYSWGIYLVWIIVYCWMKN